MECAGIVEAGGVKNVTYSLCKEFAKSGNNVSLIIPVFSSTDFKNIIFSEEKEIFYKIPHCGKEEAVSYKKGTYKNDNFNVIFFNHKSFSEKEGVYTYTANEAKKNPEFIKGNGHKDCLFMDSLFAKGVVAYGDLIKDEQLPQIVHCQDASTSLIPSIAKKSSRFDLTKFVVTIHNAGPAYHHNFASIGEAAWYTGLDDSLLNSSLNHEKVEPFLLASNSGAYLTTVSEEYAKELCNPVYSNETEGLSEIFYSKNIEITGITNGIDYESYDPINTGISKLPFTFNPKILDLKGKFDCRKYFVQKVLPNRNDYDGVQIFGDFDNTEKCNEEIYIVYHGRVTSQKGLPVLLDSIPHLLNNFENIRFLIAGQGEFNLENSIKEMTEKYKGSVIFINGYNKKITRLTNAIGDFIILPSHFEPCGLEDFISQIYGTLPIAHKTGGLNKIVNGKTGFLYTNNVKESLIAKISQVITIKIYNPEVINNMIKFTCEYLSENYLWEKVIKNKYLPFFEKIMEKN